MKLTRGKLLSQNDGPPGRTQNTYSWINMMRKGCSAIQSALKTGTQSSILSGHTPLRRLTVERMLAVSATAQHDLVLYEFLMKLMSCLFYAIAAAENLLMFGSDVSNAFAEAPPPKQGFYIRPDKAFHEWCVKHKHCPPIPPGDVIPVLSAMQGHPESPRLLEKHADVILRELGLKPTVHEPCLYSGTVDGKQIVFMRQVDNFAIAAPDERTSDILLDMIDEKQSNPLKRKGLLDMYNGIDILQTKDYIKIDVHSYIQKFCSKYEDTWLSKVPLTKNCPTPLPTDPNWIKKFNSAIGPSEFKAQQELATKMQIKYKSGVG
jgi:hypothetical protein